VGDHVVEPWWSWRQKYTDRNVTTVLFASCRLRLLTKEVHTRSGSYVCETPQHDGDREKGLTDRLGLRPRLHSYTDEPHAMTQLL
jgi:hypothetical protein